MEKINDYEMNLLNAYLKLPNRKLLNHQFEFEEDYLAGFVLRFVKGERYEKEFIAFSREEMEVINSIISKNINSPGGKDLLTSVLLTRIVCNIMNKYKK